jgi:hypothetical protein
LGFLALSAVPRDWMRTLILLLIVGLYPRTKRMPRGAA